MASFLSAAPADISFRSWLIHGPAYYADGHRRFGSGASGMQHEAVKISSTRFDRDGSSEHALPTPLGRNTKAAIGSLACSKQSHAVASIERAARAALRRGPNGTGAPGGCQQTGQCPKELVLSTSTVTLIVAYRG
eukprot:6205544-Pleurochrysis_carterae.AAC.1